MSLADMVAAGTTTLMAAADSSTSKPSEDAIQNTQQLNSDSGRRTTTLSSKRRDSLTTPNRTMFIRETKASRLRAASIISPTDGSHASRRTAFIENAVTSHSSSNSSTGNSSTAQKNSIVTRSSSIPQILSRDREKHRQMSTLCSSKVPGVDGKFIESNANENNPPRRSKKFMKTSPEQSSSQTISSNSRSSSSFRPSSISKLSAIKSPASQNSTGVLERVDALTALTKATMKRVEKLASSSLASSTQLSVTVPITRELKGKSTRLNSPKLPNYADRKIGNQSAPVSILKNKTSDSCDVVQNEVNPLPSVAFKLDERIIKKHGILKKRSSLDENEILRRNCNSPDSILINNESITSEEFRSILKYQRRSSLDELVKRSRNTDQQNPPSILKRKWLKFGCDDDKEETEPQGILKKNSQSLIDAVAKTLGVTWTEVESIESIKEVRPILKKKISQEESSSSDPPSLEPRPILKKKTSTESDEHDDKPRKTILKYSSRKNSEDSSNECETMPNSPNKLTVIRQNSLQRRTNSLPECDTNLVKPILKNPRSRSIYHESLSTHLVLRKRARSVGHDSTDFADDRTNWEKRDRGGEDEQIVTFKFPDDNNDGDRNVRLDEKLAFDSEEARRRRLDHYSAKARRDKRFSRRNRDRTKIVNEVVTIANEALDKVELAGVGVIEEGQNHLRVPNDVGHEESYDRFCTQPVTHQEVQEATGLIKRERNFINEDRSLGLMGNNGIDGSVKKDDLSDPSKLSLAERVKLFNRKIATESAAKAGIPIGQRRTSNRFRTQPVTSEEVEDAARNVPNALVTNSDEIQRHSSMKHPNVKRNQPGKSILKTTNSHTVSDANHRLSSMALDACSDISQDLSSNHAIESYEKSIEVKNYSGNTVPYYTDNTDNKLTNNIIIEENRTTHTNNFDNWSRDQNHCKSLEAVKNLRSMKTTTQSLNFPNRSIAERLAALKRSGSTNWKRRIISESLPVSVIVDKSITTDKDMEKRDICQTEKEELVITQKRLADRLEKLESAAEGWRKRVTTADAVKFSVAGKMRYNQIDKIEDISKPVFESMGNCAGIERKKKTPKKDAMKREISEDARDTSDKKISDSISCNGVSESDSLEVSIQQVPRADDETFTSFYDRTTPEDHREDSIDITEDDFDLITTESELLGLRRSTQMQRRRVSTTHNPLKILAARTDLKSEYTEIKTGVAARMLKLNCIEKLGRNSSLAVEVLAGLASTENFSAISLKSIEDNSTGFLKLHPKDLDILLILIKGRRHIQVRLIEPSVASINSGDNYILVTRNEIYHYIGKYSNVIERSRANEIAMNIFQTKDFGCKASKIVTINEDLMMNSSTDCDAFWKLLGHSESSLPEIIDAGHPDEDELYESALIDTNIVYEVVEDKLVPLDKYWGTMPKIKMLEPSKILIFDFGTEMYIWNGKCAPSEIRRASIKLAESLWNDGYDYSDCSISPINAASLIGKRSPKKYEVSMRNRERPSWCLLAKLTQHMETILFREKFLDWPNAYGIIKCRMVDKEIDKIDAKIILEPSDIKCLINYEPPSVDLVLEGCHLGRGTEWFDEEFSRQYLVTTSDVKIWHIDEYSYSRVNNFGYFFSGDSYIIRWMYLITVTGRELSGMPSKHAVEGRDRCAYFIWQGKNASINKQGTAALLTVELDKEQGQQIRVVEGSEPPAFLNLFRGGMIVYSGKQSENYKAKEREKIRSFFCRGTRKSEVSLLEVPYSSRQLRTRGSLIFVNHEIGVTYVWYGKNSLPHVKSNTFHAAEILLDRRPIEAGFRDHEEMRIVEIDEGREPEDFLQRSMNRKLYGTMNRSISQHTPRLFHFSSISGEFKVSEVLCSQRDEETVPFPFLQEELYQASQPTLFLFDNKDELWLWQGWWPDTGSKDQTGSGAIRWQAERRAAMTTTLQYWKLIHNDDKKCQIFLVWAGLEPLEFINLFPTWCNRDDIAELNMKDGRTPGEMLSLEKELTRLTQSTYPPAQLLQRPLPEGVDPTSLELYLSPQHFQELLGMNIEEFQNLPSWKQIDIKKRIGLF